MKKEWHEAHANCCYYKFNDIVVSEVSKLSYSSGQWIAGYGFNQHWETFSTKEKAMKFVEEKFD